MRSSRPLLLFVIAFTVAFGFFAIAVPLFAVSREQVLYSFCPLNGCPDGAEPFAGLVFDSAGNLYGTTEGGGAAGTVFELMPGADGNWTETVLHSFGNGSDGAGPQAGLVLDADGNLYGTTYYGGAYDSGIVFKLAPGPKGVWTETILHSFGKGTDGALPVVAGLVFDTAGNLYGTTEAGGVYGVGAVFRLTPGADGSWKESVLHSFNPNGKDGVYPEAGLTFDAAGNLYSTTASGGAYNYYGTVFELSPRAGGQWTEKVIYSFNGADGGYPQAGLIFDAAGNLYGTTFSGGVYSYGTVFQLAKKTRGKWTEKVLHSFDRLSKNGSYLDASLIMDAAGKLYSTTFLGGDMSGCAGSGCGLVFELARSTNGKWRERVLHRFHDTNGDGFGPLAGLVLDAAGNLYGTTRQGGAYYFYGTVFEITP